ncbi:MAG: hypothetical protein JSV80_03175 [Acidobacteriota bacterium]|nr:MAG: hypothetical protein JSV80_03175 [Acidobacteriota bacterium]
MSRLHPILPSGAEPCVWMSAGLVSYKLCDRDFDCEHCPLDAALRGDARAIGAPADAEPAPMTWSFPTDRLYSSGHLWIQPRERDGSTLMRLGLDALAVALLGTCLRVRWGKLPRELDSGEAFCELELDVGRLPLSAPESGRLVTRNEQLDGDPRRLLSNPYGAGWIAELSVPDAENQHQLLSARDAREQSQLDLKRFRRFAAIQMLTDGGGLGQVLADGGERLTDVRQMLGAPGYLRLLRELIH